MGFHEIAKYYYSPGWHEPGSNLEIIVNKRLFDTLTPDLKAILRTAAFRLNMWILSEFEAKNNEYLQKIITESEVEVRPLHNDILRQMKIYTKETIQELVDKDAKTRTLYESYSKFQKNINEWSQYSESAYYNMMNNG
jgi:TRAP-type mannitol/chloroaromatic compound transport system substrate-binding protein